MINAEEARKLMEDSQVAADSKQLQEIEIQIYKEASLGEDHIYVDYIRKNVENELTSLGYKISKESKCSFGNEIEYIISWANEDGVL